MPKLKYYNDTQRLEGKQIAMLEYQEKKRLGLITQLGGKCIACDECNSDTLILTEGALLCANCHQKNKAIAAQDRLTRRKEALQQCRTASWQQELAKKGTNEPIQP